MPSPTTPIGHPRQHVAGIIIHALRRGTRRLEIKDGQPTDAYLVNIRSVTTSVLLLAPYDEENRNHNLMGLVWSTSKYMETHQRNLAFHIPTRPVIYNPSITDDDKPAVIQEEFFLWKARVNNYKLYSKARALILHAVEETWVLEIKDEEALFTQITPRQLPSHLHSICGRLQGMDVLTLQNEMQDYHTDIEGIFEYINALEAAKKKPKRGTSNNPITDKTLLLIAKNTMLKTGAHL